MNDSKTLEITFLKELRPLYHDLLTFNSKDQASKLMTNNSARLVFQQMLSFADRHVDDKFFEYSERSLDLFVDRNYRSTWEKYQDTPYIGNVRKDIVKQAPSKLIDGYWLSEVSNLSTSVTLSDQVKDILRNIHFEEIGEGEIEKNHVYIYRKLLEEASIDLPSTLSQQFVTSELFSDEDFLSPVVQLCFPLLQSDYFPEMLGFTLNFEETPLSILKMMDAVKEEGLNPAYYMVHVTVDNPCSGHSSQAKQAINLYMKEMKCRNLSIDTAWRRVLRGYILASMMTLKSIHSPPNSEHVTPREAMLDLINRFKPYAACPVHGGVRMNGKSLENAMKHQPAEAFIDQLSKSIWIYPGNPDKSLLLKSLNFGHKMYGVFSNCDKRIIREWILSLKPRTEKMQNELAIPSKIPEELNSYCGSMFSWFIAWIVLLSLAMIINF